MAKRQKITSAEMTVEVMQKASEELLPPKYIKLSAKDKPFWEGILKEKAKIEWSEHDLGIAAMLAKSMRQLEEESNWLESEGCIMMSDRGAPCHNPRMKMVADLHSRVMKYRMSLSLNSRAKGGETRDIERRREIAKGIEANNPLEDDMLAMPKLRAVG